MDTQNFYDSFSALTNFKKNRFHPLVWINGDPEIGQNVYIGGMSEINAKGARVVIGDNCDIASFVAINCADSHKKCIGIADQNVCKDIIIEQNVFVGSHSVIKGGAHIRHHSVVAAGTIVDACVVPPYSLIVGNPMQIKEGYYLKQNNQPSFIQHNKPTLGKEEISAATRVIKSGWVAQGTEVEHFEDELCDFLKLPQAHAVAVSSGTAALFLALHVLEAKNNFVGLPVYTCSALRHAIAMAEAREFLIDCDSSSPNLDIQQLKASGVPLAIVPHTFGIPQAVAGLKKIKIIEDCAQALGANVKGIPVGLQGDCGIFSFYATKLITTGGQGGAFVSKNKDLVDSVRDYINFDQRRDNKIRFNFQMTDLQAAIGREQLKKLSQLLKRRAEIFDMYKTAKLDLIDAQPCEANIIPVRYRAVIKTPHAKELINKLAIKGIKTIVPIEAWELLGDPTFYKNAFNLTQQTISLPLYPSLTDEQVQKIISGVLS